MKFILSALLLQRAFSSFGLAIAAIAIILVVIIILIFFIIRRRLS